MIVLSMHILNSFPRAVLTKVSKKRFALLSVALMMVALPLTLIAVQSEQDTRQEASTACGSGGVVGGGGQCIYPTYSYSGGGGGGGSSDSGNYLFCDEPGANQNNCTYRLTPAVCGGGQYCPTPPPPCSGGICPTASPRTTTSIFCGLFRRCPTPTPTHTPTPTPSTNPTPTPTSAHSPTPTQHHIGTAFELTVLLHGIGNVGDNVNPSQHSLSNKNPIHKERPVTVELYTTDNTELASLQGTLVYNTRLGAYVGSIGAGSEVIPSGSYRVRIKVRNYLAKSLTSIQQITSGQLNKIPALTVIAGDVDDDNKLTVLDYNLISRCYTFPGMRTTCTYSQAEIGDVDDNGINDEADIILFTREIIVQHGDSIGNTSSTSNTPTR
jgi:hypothetical protein